MTGPAQDAPGQDGPRPELARGPVLSAMAVLAVVLVATATRYGYHRDELYFRMLSPGWGHLDQPPLTPLVAWGSGQLVDEVWAMRLPAIAAACLTVIVVASLTREVGGGRLAQGLSAWGFAFASFTLSFGHVLLTSSLDLLLWPGVVLCAVRALLRDESRWWWLAGVLVGVGLYNKLLIVMLLAALAVGLLLVGPRRVLRSRHLWGGVGLAVLLGLPNLAYQVLNDLPQLAMGAALAEENGGEVRVVMWPFLLLLLGPLLVPTWVAGLVALVRRPAWRDLRFLAVAFGVLLILVMLAGAQFYYPYGLLVCLYAIGCVCIADWAVTRARRGLAWALVGLNAAGAVLVSLPVLPLAGLADSGIAELNQLTADQIGWPAYVAQVDRAVDASGADAVIASNYGEAGALDRFGTTGVAVVSGHNALFDLGGPPADADVVVVVGGQLDTVAPLFASCRVVDELDNGVGVPNEEQGAPVAVCSGPVRPWSLLWPEVAHLD